MLCEKCKKNEATVHMTHYISGKSVTRHLCDTCFQQENEKSPVDNFGSSFAEILFNIKKFADSVKNAAENQTSPAGGPECPRCSLSLNKLRDSHGVLGCPECYQTFKVMIQDTLANIQSGTIHLGKRPASKTAVTPALREAEITKLQEEIKKFIAAENYEAAAVCRDRIAALRATGEPVIDGGEA